MILQETGQFQCSIDNRLKIKVRDMGNVRPAKGYDILLEAAALLDKSPLSYRFVIAGQGKGKLYDRMLQLREELGLKSRDTTTSRPSRPPFKDASFIIRFP